MRGAQGSCGNTEVAEGLVEAWRSSTPSSPCSRHQFQEEMLQLNQNYLQDNGPLFALRQMLSVGTLCFMLLPLLCLCWVQMGSKSCELLFQGLQSRGAFIPAWAQPGKRAQLAAGSGEDGPCRLRAGPGFWSSSLPLRAACD